MWKNARQNATHDSMTPKLVVAFLMSDDGLSVVIATKMLGTTPVAMTQSADCAEINSKVKSLSFKNALKIRSSVI